MYNLYVDHGMTFLKPMVLSDLLFHICNLEGDYECMFVNLDDDQGGEYPVSLVKDGLLDYCELTGVYTIVSTESMDY